MRRRSEREKGAAKEQAPVAEEEAAREATKVVVRAKEELMLEVAKPLEAWVDKASREPPKAALKSAHAPVKAAEMAHAGMAREASPESADAMAPGLDSEKF